VSPQLYLQLARDGNPPEGESSFYFTFTGPAVYTDATKFQKIDFKDIEKGKADHDKQADNGWVAMVQHYFASAWLLPASSRASSAPPRWPTTTTRSPWCSRWAKWPPGATKVHEAAVCRPAGREQARRAGAGLELVKDYGW
jgi:YidC/Oxa1 family membrane protein insertase